MKALGFNVIIKLDETQKEYTSEMIVDNDHNSKTFGQKIPLLVKSETFQLASRYATVIDAGSKTEELKVNDRIFLRAQATVGSDFVQDGITYSVVDQAEILFKL